MPIQTGLSLTLSENLKTRFLVIRLICIGFRFVLLFCLHDKNTIMKNNLKVDFETINFLSNVQ